MMHTRAQIVRVVPRATPEQKHALDAFRKATDGLLQHFGAETAATLCSAASGRLWPITRKPSVEAAERAFKVLVGGAS